jgi:hypothetical protein
LVRRAGTGDEAHTQWARALQLDKVTGGGRGHQQRADEVGMRVVLPREVLGDGAVEGRETRWEDGRIVDEPGKQVSLGGPLRADGKAR